MPKIVGFFNPYPWSLTNDYMHFVLMYLVFDVKSVTRKIKSCHNVVNILHKNNENQLLCKK